MASYSTIPFINRASDDVCVTSPTEIAKEFTKFFKTTFVTEPDGPSPPNKPYSLTPISSVIITTESIQSVILKLDRSKLYGPDGIHPLLLKSLARFVTFLELLTHLF